MIFIILLLHYLTTLHADALPISAGVVSAVAGFVNISPSCMELGSCRELSSIIKSCLTTILACAWFARHPNVPPPNWNWLKKIGVAAFTTLSVVIVPDMMLVGATRQLISAWAGKKELNKIRKKVEQEKETGPVGEGDDGSEVDTDVRDFAKQWLEKNQPASPKKPRKYTIQEAFFVGMGGLHFYKGIIPVRPLTIKDVTDLAELGIFVMPSPEDIDDRGKSSWITKGVALMQTVSFATQCVARLALHLPTAELELAALAYTTVTVLAYLIWWKKPVNIGSPVRLVLECPTGDSASLESFNMWTIKGIFKFCRYHFKKIMRQLTTKRLSAANTDTTWRPFLFPAERLKGPHIRNRLLLIAGTVALASAFGAIHCIYSWASFASYWYGQETWYNYSAFAITVLPVGMGICSTLGTLMSIDNSQDYPVAGASAVGASAVGASVVGGSVAGASVAPASVASASVASASVASASVASASVAPAYITTRASVEWLLIVAFAVMTGLYEGFRFCIIFFALKAFENPQDSGIYQALVWDTYMPNV